MIIATKEFQLLPSKLIQRWPSVSWLFRKLYLHKRDFPPSPDNGRTGGSGLLPKIFSIFSIISGVNLGMTSRALRLSMTCSGLLAPRIIVLVFGSLASHASASWAVLQSSSVIQVKRLRDMATTRNTMRARTLFRYF